MTFPQNADLRRPRECEYFASAVASLPDTAPPDLNTLFYRAYSEKLERTGYDAQVAFLGALMRATGMSPGAIKMLGQSGILPASIARTPARANDGDV